MNYEERINLKTGIPYLIQRGDFMYYEKSKTPFGRYIRTDYMGSSEFEWGALPQSLKRMTFHKEQYNFVINDNIKDEKGRPMILYAPKCFENECIEYSNGLAEDKYNLQERSHLKDYLNQKDYEKRWGFEYQYDTNFWWDITNDFFMFFENQDKVEKAMNGLKEERFDKKFYEKEYNKDPRFRKHILEYQLDCENFREFRYNHKTNSHTLYADQSFNVDATIMEGMMIAKLLGGRVRINHNGIKTALNKNTTLEEARKPYIKK